METNDARSAVPCLQRKYGNCENVEVSVVSEEDILGDINKEVYIGFENNSIVD